MPPSWTKRRSTPDEPQAPPAPAATTRAFRVDGAAGDGDRAWPRPGRLACLGLRGEPDDILHLWGTAGAHDPVRRVGPADPAERRPCPPAGRPGAADPHFRPDDGHAARPARRLRAVADLALSRPMRHRPREGDHSC